MSLEPDMLLAAGRAMDRIDWAVFIIAILGLPVAAIALYRWWRQTGRRGLGRDWQSLALQTVGLASLAAIIAWYLLVYIRAGRY